MLLNKKLPFLSICVVLSLIFQFLACIIPTNTIFLSFFSTVFTMLGVLEYNISGGILIYITSSILGFIIIPNKSIWFLILAFFGYYPILKAIIERLKRLYLEWFIKIISGSFIFLIVFHIYKILFFSDNITLSFSLIYFISLIIFIIYDISLSLFLNFYIKKIKPHIKKM